jgi:3',5'-cyclic AMP phosphodiesterase CpdA
MNRMSVFFVFLFLSLPLVGNGQRIRYSEIGKPRKGVVGFSFVHLTDLHIGEGFDDYGTPGWDDEPPPGDVGYSAQRLRKSVNWINRHADSLRIRFVMVTGDLTDSGEKSEFLKCREILNDLQVPYIPLIGNHDVWPYTRSEEAPDALGDRFFNGVFDEAIAAHVAYFSRWDDGTRQKEIVHPETGNKHQFQNFSFSFNGYRFIATDFGTRRHAGRGEPGVGPSADLHDFTGGSFPWFGQQLLKAAQEDKAVFVFSHWPLMKEPIRFHFAFDGNEYGTLAELLFPYGQKLSTWFSGHIHRSFAQNVTLPGSGESVIRCVETSANKKHGNGYLRVVNVW